MKRIANLLLVSVAAISLVACGNASGGDDNDSTKVSVTPEQVAPANQVGEEQSVVGVVIDAAMNSVELLTASGDTAMCSFPELPAEKRASWNLGDTITVKQVRLTDGTDSVTAILKGVKP